MRREIIEAPDGVDPHAVAAQARYVGSPEHKTYPSFAGPARPRADASKCDPSLRQDELTAWLQDAIREGFFGGPWEQSFPRYVWAERQGAFYEARLTNAASGDYKGYPLTANEFRSIR